jgi:hypothetical protein
MNTDELYDADEIFRDISEEPDLLFDSDADEEINDDELDFNENSYYAREYKDMLDDDEFIEEI